MDNSLLRSSQKKPLRSKEWNTIPMLTPDECTMSCPTLSLHAACSYVIHLLESRAAVEI